ncbi:haloacid dehalogenase type II [Undibacterium sp. SXout7W]|uniref:haloacid dehalogenase type II n=1 Tax=Undibacterium sp. SXout7W TaxID=3413049 RepID=UPI003BF343B7
MHIQAIAFDAYGTLFDVYSVGALGEKLFPGQGDALAQLWRRKQIEYTQLRTMCSMYKPFWEVTQDALVFVCRQLGLELTIDAQNALMGQYARLDAFPENIEVLKQLRSQGMKLSILSNGTSHMLHSAVDAAGMQGMFNHLMSVETVEKFKTAPEAYQMGPDVFGVPAKNILFVSSNCWDVCCATWFGYTTFWVNRTGAPLEELGVSPHGEGRSLKDVIAFIEQVRN